jgi:hypothetical protein
MVFWALIELSLADCDERMNENPTSAISAADNCIKVTRCLFKAISAVGATTAVSLVSISAGGKSLIKECSFISCNSSGRGVLWADSGVELAVERCCATECKGENGGFVWGKDAEVNVSRSTLLKVIT